MRQAVVLKRNAVAEFLRRPGYRTGTARLMPGVTVVVRGVVPERAGGRTGNSMMSWRHQ